MRFHILGIPHTVTTVEYSTCAFTQKVVKLCTMLLSEGHEVIHYGNELSAVACTEHVTVTTAADLETSYPGHDWRKNGFPNFAKTDHVYEHFYLNAIRQIGERKKPGDFLLITFGDWQRPIAYAHPDLITVESGIGYPNGAFAKFRVYESYAIMHAYQGNGAAATASNDFWYDAVIPNAFNLDEFEYRDQKENFLLFLGRVNSGKGIHIAKQIAEATETKLIVAGPGVCETTEFVQPWGVADPASRKFLMSRAKAVLCPSTFLEPFCGVQIEAMLSGTPVISTDRGAFGEYNRHGLTGYRCKTFEQFLWAARNIDAIYPGDCREWGERFSLDNIGPMYTDYFRSVQDIFNGKGWYELRPSRTTLDHSSFG